LSKRWGPPHISTIAPNGATASTGDGGPYSQASFRNATALATDRQGNLFIADGPYIRKIEWKTGIVSTIAGSGQPTYSKDGVPALDAHLSFMTGLVIDAQENVWIADAGNARVFKISASTKLIKTVAGTSANGDGGLALGAVLSPLAAGLAADSKGDLYFWDGGIRHVDHATGIISTTTVQNGLVYGESLGNASSAMAAPHRNTIN
jgi:hypothetical protein